jgi:hypothetical protein
VESDQGSALKAICNKYQNTHLACIRHLLVSLKQHHFSFQVGNLVKCRTIKDFVTLKELYQPEFSRASGTEKSDLTKLLKKIGLRLESEIIMITDEIRWKEVSMIERIQTKMPPTTNALESTHGHLNEMTPRRNLFFKSLFRIAKMMIQKTFHYEQSLKQNFHSATRKAKQRCKRINEDQMKNEQAFYETGDSQCECGEMIHYSAMYRVSMPCSHLYFNGIAKPILPPELKLTIEKNYKSLVIEFKVIERETREIEDNNINYLKNLAVKNIKRFSNSTQKEEIIAYVQTNFHIGDTFVLGQPVSVYQLISAGISLLSSK